MFFSKFIAPAVAFLGVATSVFASPIAQPVTSELTKRGADEVYDTCKHVYDTCSPLIADLTVAVDVGVSVGVIAEVFAEATVALEAYVDLDIEVDVQAIVDINVSLITNLVVALSNCDSIDASIWVQVDAFISAYLAILAKINVGICTSIALYLPRICIQLLVSLKLVLSVQILGLVDITL